MKAVCTANSKTPHIGNLTSDKVNVGQRASTTWRESSAVTPVPSNNKVARAKGIPLLMRKQADSEEVVQTSQTDDIVQ